jgi:hypothetical protein
VQSVHLRRAALASVPVVAIALGVLLIRGTNRPAHRPKPVPSRTVPGFNEVSFRVTGPMAGPAAATPTRCALLAATDSQQHRGLMNRHDLGGYDAMIFQFGRPTTVPFYMKDTLIPGLLTHHQNLFRMLGCSGRPWR